LITSVVEILVSKVCAMSEKTFDVIAHLRGVLGMIVGAVAGYFVFVWLVDQGFYALVLPGATLGLGCGYASRIRSPWLAAIGGVGAALLLIFCEWKVFPFVADGSLSYFVAHLHQLRGLTLIFLLLGILAGAWFSLGRPKIG